MKEIKYFFDSITSKAYWQYVLFSKSGISSIFSIFGAIYLVVEALDFFDIYSRDKYSSYAFFIFGIISIIISILIRRPVKSISVNVPNKDIVIEVRIADLFDVCGAVVISTNSIFEADVAGGKIASDSLQGQFTAKYFTGNQLALIRQIELGKEALAGESPFAMGSVIPISTHGKEFYFTVMADLNEHGNASTTINNIKQSLDGLWSYVNVAGELQELALPVLGTGRGRLQTSRKKVISIMVESFLKASQENKFTDKFIIVVSPDDAKNFSVNLYDIKDSIKHIL